MDEQTKNELRVFKKFAKVCPYPIDFDSIEKRRPPEPDIFCKLSDGITIAFEVVECIDESIALSIYEPLQLRRAFDTELEKLSTNKKQRIKTNFSNASIYIAFHNGISKNKKWRSIKPIFNYLLTFKNGAEGEFDLKFNPYLKNEVRYILIQRGVSGPIFDIEAIASFSDPARKEIEKKIFKKKYKTNANMELFCYYELQPELPDDYWLPPVIEFVKINLKNSPFRRVWIYSVTKNKIIYVCPHTPSSPSS